MNDTRIRIVPDNAYQTVGSYALDTDGETRAAEQWEQERLKDGRLVVVGLICEERCPTCGRGWNEVDSLWGVVVTPDELNDETALAAILGVTL